jgi:ribosomal protein S12 methylthiotransferase
VPEKLKVGEFAEVKITDYHDYDLLALPPGEKPAHWKIARQAQ